MHPESPILEKNREYNRKKYKRGLTFQRRILKYYEGIQGEIGIQVKSNYIIREQSYINLLFCCPYLETLFKYNCSFIKGILFRPFF